MSVVYIPSKTPKPQASTTPKSNSQKEVGGWMKVAGMAVDGLITRNKPAKPAKNAAG